MFFRTEISHAEAVDRLFEIVINTTKNDTIVDLEKEFEVVPNDLVRQVMALSLLGVHITTKFSRVRGWREHGPGLFDALIIKVVAHLTLTYGWSEPYWTDWIARVFQAHSVSLEVHAHNPTELKRALGENLNAFVAKRTSEDIILLAEDVFMKSGEEIVKLQKTHKITS